MSEYKRQIMLGATVAIVLGVIAIAGALYLPTLITGGTTTMPTGGQTSTNHSSTFVPSPEILETTNSTLGLELAMNVSSVIVPSEDSLNVSVAIFNVRSTLNNLTASNDWPAQDLSSWPCDFGNGLLTPEGIGIFPGYYGVNNISNAGSINFWIGLACPNPELYLGVQNITSYSFLPNNDSGYYAGPSGSTAMKVSPTQMKTGEVVIWAVNQTSYFNSLRSSVPATYTLVAGDEWGQMILVHFQVVASNNLPVVGNFLASTIGCGSNQGPAPCMVGYFSQATVFNCAAQASTTLGCTEKVLPAGYTITIWYPYENQPNEQKGANCRASVEGENSPFFGNCISINSTAFAFSYI